MPQREGADDGGLQYRSPITQAAPPPAFSKDEANYDTLQWVLKELETEVEKLYKDFNLFDIGKDKLPADRAKILLHEVEVKQGVFDVLTPIVERLKSSLRTATDNYNQRNQAQ